MLRISFRLQGFGFLAVLCLVPSGGALAQTPPSSIQIFMPNGGMPSRAIFMTLVRDDDGRIEDVLTDSKGIYSMRTPTAQSMNYTITIKGDDRTFDTTTARFRLDRSNPARIPIFLKPLTAAKPPVNGVLDVASFEGNVPSKARSAYRQAMELITKGQFESAIDSLHEAISLYPEYVRARNDLGVVFLKLNRLDEAAATFRQAININQRFFHPRMNLGIVLTKQGKYREALEILEPLYQENHGMLEVRLAYAKALTGAGELSGAEKVYRSTLSSKNLPPMTQAELHFRLGSLLNREAKFTDAVAELEKAIALNQNDANSHFELGAALLQMQQLERSESELLRAYQLAQNSAGGAQLLLGQIYYTQRRFAEAQRAFEQYLKDVPSAPNAQQVARLIADLKSKSKN
jgi:Flp pilus assembly protein TadD